MDVLVTTFTIGALIGVLWLLWSVTREQCDICGRRISNPASDEESTLIHVGSNHVIRVCRRCYRKYYRWW